jgi:nitrile hydratase
MFRHGIERMGPAEYLETSYYEHWLHSFETLLVERGVLAEGELEEKIASLRQAGES